MALVAVAIHIFEYMNKQLIRKLSETRPRILECTTATIVDVTLSRDSERAIDRTRHNRERKLAISKVAPIGNTAGSELCNVCTGL